MPPKAVKKSAATKRKPLGKIDGNAVKKPAPKSKSKIPKDPKKSSAASAIESEGVETRLSQSQDVPKTSDQLVASDDGRSTNYLFLCRLSASHDPIITRLLSVPSSLKFSRFHAVLQAAFGWANSHMYSFRINELVPRNPEKDNGHVNPGREILNLTAHPFTDLDLNKSSDDYRLSDIFEGEKYAGKVEVIYEYDHGDGWEHDIVFLGSESPSVRKVMMVPDDFPALCLGGEGHPCAEDSGGIEGWEDIKELFRKPRSKDPEGLRDWYRTMCLNGDANGLDPYKWDIFDVNDELSELAKRPDFL